MLELLACILLVWLIYMMGPAMIEAAREVTKDWKKLFEEWRN